MNKIAIAVLVSGAGTNLQALIDAQRKPEARFWIACVVANRPSARAITVAQDAALETLVMPTARFGGDVVTRDRAMRDALRARNIELVVCAGYDRILSDEFLTAFPDAVLNLHPSLLPAFSGGMHAVKEALNYGVKVTGCTVHFLEPGSVDGGPVIAQRSVEIRDDDTEESLLLRVHQAEWGLLPEAIDMWCQGLIHKEGHLVSVLRQKVAGETN